VAVAAAAVLAAADDCVATAVAADARNTCTAAAGSVEGGLLRIDVVLVATHVQRVWPPRSWLPQAVLRPPQALPRAQAPPEWGAHRGAPRPAQQPAKRRRQLAPSTVRETTLRLRAAPPAPQCAQRA